MASVINFQPITMFQLQQQKKKKKKKINNKPQLFLFLYIYIYVCMYVCKSKFWSPEVTQLIEDHT